MTLDHVFPGGRVRVFKVRHKNACPGIQGVDHHLSFGGAGDLDMPALQVRRDVRHFPICGAHIRSLRPKLRPGSGIEFFLPFNSRL